MVIPLTEDEKRRFRQQLELDFHHPGRLTVNVPRNPPVKIGNILVKQIDLQPAQDLRFHRKRVWYHFKAMISQLFKRWK